MKGIVTKEDVKRVRRELVKARKQKNIKEICFLEATLSIYTKELLKQQL